MSLWLRRSRSGSPTVPASILLLTPLKNLVAEKISKPLPSFIYPECEPSRYTQCANAETADLRVSEEFCLRFLSYCNSKSLKMGISVHSSVIKMGVQDNLLLNNNLLSLYSKCHGAHEVRSLFDELPERDVVSWTGVISAYVRARNYEEALKFFYQMVASGVVPNEFTFSSVLRSCCSLEEFEAGVCIHGQIIKRGFGLNPVLASALVDFYSKCDKLVEAFKSFQEMSSRDTVSWTIVISCFSRAGDWTQALRLYIYMIEEGSSPNEFTFVKLLVAASFLSLNYGKLLHAHIILCGIKLNLILKTALVDMYSKYKRMEDAVIVLNLTPETDVMLWTALISGYAQVSDFGGVVSTFSRMEQAGISPNSFAFSSILSACTSVLAMEFGQLIQSRVIKVGLDCDVSVGNALVDLYMKNSSTVEEARGIFTGIVSPNVISWTSLIAGYAQHGHAHEAFEALANMQIAGIQPNSFTISSILKSCRTLEAVDQVRKLHAYVVKTKVDSDPSVGNSLIDAYARLGKAVDVSNVMEMMTHRDIITYTNLAAGMNQMGHHEMALNILQLMREHDVKMDNFVLASFLSAAANLSAMEPGKQLHCYAITSGLINSLSVLNSLIDMYGKCGTVREAQKVFAEITEPTEVTWNGLISGLAAHGFFSDALSRFEDMRLSGIQPDGVTFLLVLYACSHGGLADLGLEYFSFMKQAYGITPQIDHYVCLVDLLGRAGRLREAAGVIETMPFHPDALIYKTLLSSCKVHRNLVLGEEIARRALECNPWDPAVYVMLANIYDDADKLEFGQQIRQMMRERGLRKTPGQSWIELKNKVYSFTADDRSNPQTDKIHEKLDSLKRTVRSLGFPYAESAGSAYHSEKLAVAFSLLNTPSTAPIRIIKNIRICEECHDFFKLVTCAVDREIIVRDNNRFHSFNKGDCSCRGYW
ncbi:pentatricopeptide repeat-containing protein At5g52850, chloroplastic [Aristolochia californica]|uniref:pentatricopeptide repeat-containing protein At5g52850, chloroplastic n=1 Tax=Aristolochia californica TaxID=171875 RepID=UPI0035DA4B5C